MASFIDSEAYLPSMPIAGAIATGIIGAGFIIWGLLQLARCTGEGVALIGIGLVLLGVAIGLTGGWVVTSVVSGFGVAAAIFGFALASASGCLSFGF